MERLRLFRFQRFQLFLLAKPASDFAERSFLCWRSSTRRRIGVESRGRILRIAGRAIIFLHAFVSLGFDLRAIFRSQNVRMLEIFFGVNMLGAFLQFLFARAFLASCFGDTLLLLALGILLILCAGNRCAENGECEKENCGSGKPPDARDSPRAWMTRLQGHGAVWSSQQHGQTDYNYNYNYNYNYGGTPRKKECILKMGEWEKIFSWRCLGGNPGRTLIFGARNDAIGVLSLLFASEREGEGN